MAARGIIPGGLVAIAVCAGMLAGCDSSSSSDFPPLLDRPLPSASLSSPWQSAQLARTIAKADEPIRQIAISPEGKTIASGSIEGFVDLWEVSTGKQLRDFSVRSRVESIAYSLDGQILATGGDDGKVRLWQASTGTFIRSLATYPFPVQSIAFSPDGTTLATSSWKKTVELWHVSTGQLLRTLTGHSDTVNAVVFSPDGKTLASGSYDGTIRLWNPTTGDSTHTFVAYKRPVYTLAFSPDGKQLVSGGDNTIKLWDLQTTQLHATLIGHSDVITAIAIPSDGRAGSEAMPKGLIISGSRDKTIKIWDSDTGALLKTLSDNPILAVVITPDGRTIASAGNDGKIKLWRPAQ